MARYVCFYAEPLSFIVRRRRGSTPCSVQAANEELHCANMRRSFW
jgi:hypothetical protein